MCQRKDKEPLFAYLCRWAVEAFVSSPVAVVCIFCLGATAWMYHDMSDLMKRQGELIERQTEAYVQMVAELREMNVRLQNVERVAEK